MHITLREFTRAHKTLAQAVDVVGAEDEMLPRLQRVLAVLQECGVRMRCCAHTELPELQALMIRRVARGAGHKRCTYCRQAVPLLLSNWRGECLWCACDPADPRRAKNGATLAEMHGGMRSRWRVGGLVGGARCLSLHLCLAVRVMLVD